MEANMINSSLAEVAAVSTKGQVVLPKTIREALSIVSGSKLLVLVDGENIVMKPIEQPDSIEFSELLKQSQEWASSVGMKETDIEDAIQIVRKNKRDSR